MHFWKAVILPVIAWLALIMPVRANAMDVQLLQTGLPSVFALSGDIKRGDAGRIIAQIEQVISATPDAAAKAGLYDWRQRFWIRLDSPGGDLSEAMTLGRYLRKNYALVTLDGPCVSACVFLLAGAVERVQLDAAANMIGVHRPYVENTASDAEIVRIFDGLHDRIAAYLREMRVSTVLADMMFATPPEDMSFLSTTDLKRFLPSLDPVWDELTTVRRAGLYGITATAYRQHAMTGSGDCAVATIVNRGPGVELIAAACRQTASLGIPIDDLLSRKQLFEGQCRRPPNYSAGIRAGNADFIGCARGFGN